MRQLATILHDIAALKRPLHPGVAGAMRPEELRKWKEAIALWRIARPDGDAAYCALLDECAAIEKTSAEFRARESCLRDAGVPSRILASLDAPRDTDALSLAREFCASEFRWLVLVGRTGIGKSVAAAFVCDVASRLAPVTWISAAECLDSLQRFDAAAMAANLRRVSMLVLDDLGTEGRIGPLQALLSARHDDNRRTVITANLSTAALRERLGTRVADRVRSSSLVLRAPTAESMRVPSDRRQVGSPATQRVTTESPEPGGLSTNDTETVPR